MTRGCADGLDAWVRGHSQTDASGHASFTRAFHEFRGDTRGFARRRPCRSPAEHAIARRSTRWLPHASSFPGRAPCRPRRPRENPDRPRAWRSGACGRARRRSCRPVPAPRRGRRRLCRPAGLVGKAGRPPCRPGFTPAPAGQLERRHPATLAGTVRIDRAAETATGASRPTLACPSARASARRPAGSTVPCAGRAGPRDGRRPAR